MSVEPRLPFAAYQNEIYLAGVAGEVTGFLRGFLADLEITMALCGLRSPAEATPALLSAG